MFPSESFFIRFPPDTEIPDWFIVVGLVVGPISRTNLALYAGASGDHNPLHIDTDYADQIGLPDVIAHGMLIMSYLGRVLTNNMNQNQILEYGVQFSSITNIGDVLCCSGIVKEILVADGQPVEFGQVLITLE